MKNLVALHRGCHRHVTPLVTNAAHMARCQMQHTPGPEGKIVLVQMPRHRPCRGMQQRAQSACAATQPAATQSTQHSQQQPAEARHKHAMATCKGLGTQLTDNPAFNTS
jgi:hypothetical protein